MTDSLTGSQLTFERGKHRPLRYSALYTDYIQTAVRESAGEKR